MDTIVISNQVVFITVCCVIMLFSALVATISIQWCHQRDLQNLGLSPIDQKAFMGLMVLGIMSCTIFLTALISCAIALLQL